MEFLQSLLRRHFAGNRLWRREKSAVFSDQWIHRHLVTIWMTNFLFLKLKEILKQKKIPDEILELDEEALISPFPSTGDGISFILL